MNTFYSVAVSFRYNSLGYPRDQAMESWAEPGHESLEDAVYNCVQRIYEEFLITVY